MSDLTPIFATLGDWMRISGMRKMATYEALARGDLRGHKIGKRTLIDVQAGLAWIRAQPGPDVDPSAPSYVRGRPQLSASGCDETT